MASTCVQFNAPAKNMLLATGDDDDDDDDRNSKCVSKTYPPYGDGQI